MKFTARSLAAGLLLALPNLALTSSLAAQESTETVQTAEPIWAFEASDLPVDPGYVFGRLDNGMRYVLRQNATPEGTAMVRMRIDSGSLDETDYERGLSHYLEHMAFNGSKGIPEGEMIKLLEREGLSFGADTNASTGYDAITYMLNLPRNDEALLDTALMLMRETASELTIAPDAVDRERGVVLAERRDRAGYQQRNYEDSMEFVAPGARFSQRLPIGTIESLEIATADQLRSLYERTYTPANTTLVIVGDFPVDVMEKALRAKFADWKTAPAPVDPETGPIDITRSGLVDIYTDPALSESVSLTALGPWLDEPDTFENRTTGLLRQIGYAIVNRRLNRLATGSNPPFRGAQYGTGELFEDARTTGLAVATIDGGWREGLVAATREVNQALEYGFTEAEVDEQLRNIRTSLENAVSGYDTFANSYFVGQALALVANDRIPTTPAFTLEGFDRIAPSITPENVFAAMRAHAIPLDDPLVRFAGRVAPEGGEEALRAAYAEGLAAPIAAPEDTGPLEFSYTDFGESGTVVSDSVEERLGIRRIVFDNNVRLNIKQTDVREDRVQVDVRVDGGDLMGTADDPLRVYLANSLTAGGLGELSIDEIQSALAGRSVGFRFSSDAEGFGMGATTTPRDLELQMQVFAATLTDPGYRNEGVERFRQGIDNFFETLTSTPARAYSAAAGGLLSDNDPRFTLQPKEAYERLDFAALRSAIGDRLQNGAIEVGIVGDIDEDAAIAAVAATLGALPQRETEFNRREEARQRRFTSERGLKLIEHGGEADQSQIRLIWPTTDDEDYPEALRLSLLARVAQLELTDRLREELGQAYSPSASSGASSVYTDYGTFSLAASVDVDQVEAVREAMGELVANLRAEPVSEDTLERARKPVLEAYDNALKGLGGWMNLTERAQSEPRRIERWFMARDLIEGITPPDIRAEAVQYLAPDDAVEIRVVPGPDARPGSGSEADMEEAAE